MIKKDTQEIYHLSRTCSLMYKNIGSVGSENFVSVLKNWEQKLEIRFEADKAVLFFNFMNTPKNYEEIIKFIASLNHTDVSPAEFFLSLTEAGVIEVHSHDEAKQKQVDDWEVNGWRSPFLYFAEEYAGDVSDSLKANSDNSDNVPSPQFFREVELKPSELEKKKQLHEVLLNRRTCRNFSSEPVSLVEFTSILERANPFLNKGDLIVYAINVNDLDSGVYYYNTENSLKQYRRADVETLEIELHMILIGQSFQKGAAFAFFLRPDFSKYGTYGNALFQMGRLVQDMIIGSGQSDLHCFQTPAIRDSILRSFLGITGLDSVFHTPVYFAGFGRKVKDSHVVI